MRRITLLTLFAAAGLMAAGPALAQDLHLRPEGTAFIKPKVGISSYFGDNEKSPTNFNGDAFETAFPWGLGIEGGYQLTVQNSFSLGLYIGDYPVITQFPPPPVLRTGDDLAADPSVRTSVQAIYRRTFGDATSAVAPYVNLGLNYSFGTVTQNKPPSYEEEESGSAFGPLVGLGVDFALNPRSSFFVEWNFGMHFADDQLDANADNGGVVDVLTGLGVGFKVNFDKALTPVGVHSISCMSPEVGENMASFEGAINEAASEPVELGWDFGDGNSGTGLAASHTYAASGVYTVTFTASNAVNSDMRECQVTVVDPAEIVTVTTNKSTVSICDDDPSVAFSANVRGDAPLTYAWDFGDGNTSDAENPSHAYAEPGSYTALLTLSNAHGTDSREVTVTVTDEGCFNCDISQMNTVFFDRNSSELTEDGRAQLVENLEILQNCEFGVRIEGHASRDERRTQQLSEARAAAVMQYYVDNGIDPSRMPTEGMGASGQTTKKDGASQFRRADTIPDM